MAGTTLAAATFTGQVVFTGNSPQWTEQGPLPYSRGFGLAPNLWDPAAGAVQAVAVDPTDPLTMYVGTTNGGVWRNTGSKAVYFALNESTLTADDKATLDAFANFLEEHPLLTVEVGGHTDTERHPGGQPDPSPSSGPRRARDYLVNTRRINPGALTVRGFGADRPVAQNDATGLQPLNRRVELLVNNWKRGVRTPSRRCPSARWPSARSTARCCTPGSGGRAATALPAAWKTASCSATTAGTRGGCSASRSSPGCGLPGSTDHPDRPRRAGGVRVHVRRGPGQ